MEVFCLLQEYRALEKLDFSGKGEQFVRENFVSPLLKYLGYDGHKDFEVKRDGDEGMSFKLKHISVERGARKIKALNPDYMPTIRKRCFWTIEAKTARDLPYPFADNFIVQGMQYCIHPEIRAKYLVLTNGLYTSVYDSFSRIYGDGDIYEPLLTFSHTEIGEKWGEIYQLLSAEKVREFIEEDVLHMYEKLVTSSFDSEYPGRMLSRAESISVDASKKIKEHVSCLRSELFNQYFTNQQEECRASSIEDLDFQMDLPLIGGKGVGQHFVEKSIGLEYDEKYIFSQLTSNYQKQTYFRKRNVIAGLCTLFKKATDAEIKENVVKFLQSINNNELPILNQVECATVRIRRKFLVVKVYPELSRKIESELNVTPEFTRYINPPTVVSETSPDELIAHWATYTTIVHKSDQELNELLNQLIELEAKLDVDYNKIALKSNEKGLFDNSSNIGLDYEDDFSNIMKNLLGKKYKLIDETFDGFGFFLQDDE